MHRAARGRSADVLSVCIFFFFIAAIVDLLQVEVEYAKNAFDNILRNQTLEDLYAANGKALGVEFTTDEEVLRNASGESTEKTHCTPVVKLNSIV